MAKLRIFQIAKELNISHTDIVSFLKSKKIEVSSHMSPVNESVHQMIMSEFAKDKEQVERFRKEQVRKEIHDVRLKKQQESSKKLKLLFNLFNFSKKTEGSLFIGGIHIKPTTSKLIFLQYVTSSLSLL